MKYIKTRFIPTALFLLATILPQYSSAHVMTAQHGTLNVLNKSVFMVLSLPVSAFYGLDDDNDGKLSNIEFNQHRQTIAKVVHEKVILKDQSGKLVLQDMMLSPVTPHHSPKAPVSQLIVMGRYNLSKALSALEYKIELFGTAATEQLLKISARRKSDNKTQQAKLTPKNSSVSIF